MWILFFLKTLKFYKDLLFFCHSNLRFACTPCPCTSITTTTITTTTTIPSATTIFEVRGTDPKAYHTLGKCSIHELHPQSLPTIISLGFETESKWLVQAGLELRCILNLAAPFLSLLSHGDDNPVSLFFMVPPVAVTSESTGQVRS